MVNRRGKAKNRLLQEMDRRSALRILGIGAGAIVLTACRGGQSPSDNGSDGGAGDAGADCEVTPEGEVGPYFADDSATGFNRSNILSNLDGTGTQPGVPLTLNITVVDAEKACAPYVGAQVDIWHCNADGVYSDISSENTSTEQWLRGYQITDVNGRVTFQTIIPGWYAGRATHIHLRIRSSYSEVAGTSDEENTTQCFFPQSFLDTLDTTVSPYSSEGTNPTTNASDRVYSQQEKGSNVLSPAGSTSGGYAASVVISLPITTDYAAGVTGDGGMGGSPPGDGGMTGPGGSPPS